MGRPLLCTTVTATTMTELRRKRDAVAEGDLVELRLDTVRDPDVAGALSGRRRPVIVTCRPTWEGGHFGGAEAERRRLLGEAVDRGAEYVDVEWQAGFHDLLEAGRNRIVLSMHDFAGVPGDLEGRVRAMQATGAGVVKLAARVLTLSDCVSLYDLASKVVSRSQPLVVIGMGEAGLATRVLAARFGSAWTYAGENGAIGQMSARSLVDEYRFTELTQGTDVYGLVGRPVAHSVSPAMHNGAFRASGLDAVYIPLLAADADDFVVFARSLGLKGASVTTPYKVPLYARTDEASSLARRIGAVNTLRLEGGRWIGENTDVTGFLEPLRALVDPSGTRAAVLGAGGSARAAAVALGSCGADVRVHARDPDRAREVAGLVSAQTGPWPPAPGTWDLLVNCTPIGMHPRDGESPIPRDLLTGRVVYDLVYNPPSTQLLRDAAAAGCRTIGGLEMLVAQAEAQFQWWTGVRPKAGVMRDAARARLMEFTRNENHVV